MSGQAHFVLGEIPTPLNFLTGDRRPDMTSAPIVTSPQPAFMADEPPGLTQRFQLRPEAPTTGHVDGAWWPRSRDLAAELPALLAALAARLGRVHRVGPDNVDSVEDLLSTGHASA